MNLKTIMKSNEQCITLEIKILGKCSNKYIKSWKETEHAIK